MASKIDRAKTRAAFAAFRVFARRVARMTPGQLGAEIKKHRLRRSLTQQQAAEMLGAKASSVDSWEAGRRRPRHAAAIVYLLAN